MSKTHKAKFVDAKGPVEVPTGTTITEAADKVYIENHGTSYKFSHLLDTLCQMPKFNWRLDQQTADEANDNQGGSTGKKKKKKAGDPLYNELGAAMGATMERPMGSKAAKKLSREMSSQASVDTRKLTEFSRVASSNDRMARAMEDCNYQDGLVQQANMFRMMGNMAECQRVMNELSEFLKMRRDAQAAREQPEEPTVSVPWEVDVQVPEESRTEASIPTGGEESIPTGATTEAEAAAAITAPAMAAAVNATIADSHLPALGEAKEEEEMEEEVINTASI